MSQNPLVKIKILVVDDDSVSLAIVSSMLKTCSLQDQLIELSVITVRNGIDALSTIQAQDEKIDLVIVDFHVPGKSGWELQKQVDEKFKIPVIFMFSDSVESIIAKSLDSGAVFHIVKPVKQQDIKKAWKCVVASKKAKAAVVVDQETMAKNKNIEEEIGSSNEQEVSSASSVNEESSQKGKKRIRDGENEVANIAPKKAKIIWTNSLHNRFLQAINHIGLEKAVPKRILEFMNVPGLTRENVASHLQV